MDRYIHAVHPSISTINQITEKNSKSLILPEQRIIPRNVLLDAPNDPSSRRLRCAATKKLNPTEPNAEDAIILPAFTGCAEYKDNIGEFFGWAVGGRSVVHKKWRFAVSEAKVVLGDVIRARLGVRMFDGLGHFKEASWWPGVIEGSVL